jgi:geranylgeranyl pyrophosphate synthase
MRELACSGEGSLLATAAAYHLDSGGKRLRAHLALEAGWQLGLIGRSRVAVAATCELVHNASLVHDDLQDGDRYRRGGEAVWSRFGEGAAICLGDHLLSAGFRALARAGGDSASLVDLLGERVAELSSGQAEELALCRAGQVGDWASYERIAALKTAPLLSLPLELPFRLAGGADGYGEAALGFARGFGLAYQIHDDIEDLRVEGRRPEDLPPVHAVRALIAEGHGEGAVGEAAERGRAHLQAAGRWLGYLPTALAAELEGQMDRLHWGLE